MQILKEYQQILKEKGVRITRQRLAILEIFREEQKPLSAQIIYNKLKEDDDKLQLSTVYRNLNTFVVNNMIRKMEFDLENKESYFELQNGEHHHHLVCIECGEIIPLCCPLKKYEQEIGEKTGYEIKEHRIKLFGICPNCNED